MSYDIQIGNPSGAFADGGHDIILDGLGNTIKLYGQAKLEQDMLKILFTEFSTFYKEYATQLDELIGSNLGIQQTINVLAKRITDSLVYLQILQQEQATSQQVLSSEIIQNILTLNIDYLYDITNDENDVRTFRVTIVVQTADNQQVIVSKDVTAV